MMADAQPQRPRPPTLTSDAALFLDVDGVLLEFASSPDSVDVAPALVRRLHFLHTWLEGALALVSGRTVADLDRLFSPLQLPCAGLHGLQLRGCAADDDTQRLQAERVAPWRARARDIVSRYPGAVLEDKQIALALHWRAAPAAEPELQALADAAVQALTGFRLQRGACVVEIRPAQADKGAAIAQMLKRHPFAGRVPIFVGDDITDEDGFAVINQVEGGVSVLAGAREPSVARYGLDDVAAVHAWLGIRQED